MNLTNKQLIKLIRESLNEVDEPWEGPQGRQGHLTPKQRLATRDMGNLSFPQDDQDDPGDYYSDETDRGYDDLLEELNHKLIDLAINVIDEYKDHPNFGLEEARKEVSDVLQAAVDLFLEGRPDGQDLPTILDEEF